MSVKSKGNNSNRLLNKYLSPSAFCCRGFFIFIIFALIKQAHENDNRQSDNSKRKQIDEGVI